jgi:hypothetical protein
LKLTLIQPAGDFVSGPDFWTTAKIQAEPTDPADTDIQDAIDNNKVTWTVMSSSISIDDLPAWNRSSTALYNGLTWGPTALSLAFAQGDQNTMNGTAPNGASAELMDIVGSRTVTVKASIDGMTEVEETLVVSFGAGPLSVFKGKPIGWHTWSDAATQCGGTAGNLGSATYQRTTNLPTQAQLQAVAGSSGQGAAHAAGWPDDSSGSGWFGFWTGEADGYGDYARVVYLDGGHSNWTDALYAYPVAVCLP